MTGQGPPGSAGDLLRAFAFAEAIEEREAAHRAETEELLLAVAGVLDSLDRLLADEDSDPDSYRASARLIARQLEAAVRRGGLEPVGEPGETADPATHHVVEARPAPGVAEDVVVEVLQRGYRLRDRVLRAARVVVAAPPDAHGPPGGAPRSPEHPGPPGPPDDTPTEQE